MCNRVAIINQGKVLACDTPAALKQQLRKSALFEIKVESPTPLEKNSLTQIAGVQSCSITIGGWFQPPGAGVDRRGLAREHHRQPDLPERAYPQPAETRAHPGRCFRPAHRVEHGRSREGRKMMIQPVKERLAGWRLVPYVRPRQVLPAHHRHAAGCDLAGLRCAHAHRHRRRLRSDLPGGRRAAGLHRVRGGWRGDDRLLVECAMGYVQPALLGEGNRQPGALYHRSRAR